MTLELVYTPGSSLGRRVPKIEFSGAKPPRNVMIVTRKDGSFAVLEDDLDVLKKYRPREDETVSIHRAFVRRSP